MDFVHSYIRNIQSLITFLKFKVTYKLILFKEATFSAAVKQMHYEQKNVTVQHMVLLEQNASALKEQRGMLLFPTTLPQD